MSSLLSPSDLRQISKKARENEKEAAEKECQQRAEKQNIADQEEAQGLIRESAQKIEQAARAGKNEAVVAVLRGGGRHFDPAFRSNLSLEYLGTVGKVLYEYFQAKEFRVCFRPWVDPARIMELEEDSGFEMVVKW